MLLNEGRETVLKAWQARKRDVLEHPFFAEKALLGMFPQLQAQLLARHLRGEIDGYPAWVCR